MLERGEYKTKVLASSEVIKDRCDTIVELKGTDLFLFGDQQDKFTVRNFNDLKIFKSIQHKLGELSCGLSQTNEDITYLGIGNNLVEFDKKELEMKGKLKVRNAINHIEKVNAEMILIGELDGVIELINIKEKLSIGVIKLGKIINQIQRL